MIKFSMIASLLAVAVTSIPAEAADVRGAAFGSGADRSAARPFMFGGTTLRLDLDGRRKARPEIGLRLTGATRGPDMHMRIGEGLAFSAVVGTMPQLTLNGVDSRLVTKRFGMGGGGKAALIVGGLVLVGGIVAVAAGGLGDAPAAAFDED